MALPGTRRLDQGHSQELASHTACQVDLLSMKRARLPDDSHSLGERDNSLSSSWEHRKKKWQERWLGLLAPGGAEVLGLLFGNSGEMKAHLLLGRQREQQVQRPRGQPA